MDIFDGLTDEESMLKFLQRNSFDFPRLLNAASFKIHQNYSDNLKLSLLQAIHNQLPEIDKVSKNINPLISLLVSCCSDNQSHLHAQVWKIVLRAVQLEFVEVANKEVQGFIHSAFF